MSAKYQHDDIAKIAYRSWLDRGQPEGSPEVDWYYALSVVTNPEEVRPVPFGNFDSHEEDEPLSGRSANSESSVHQKSNDDLDNLPLDAQGIRNSGMQDEGMRNDTGTSNAEDTEVTRRADQFSVSQGTSPASRSRKKNADSKNKQGASVR